MTISSTVCHIPRLHINVLLRNITFQDRAEQKTQRYVRVEYLRYPCSYVSSALVKYMFAVSVSPARDGRLMRRGARRTTRQPQKHQLRPSPVMVWAMTINSKLTNLRLTQVFRPDKHSGNTKHLQTRFRFELWLIVVIYGDVKLLKRRERSV